MGHLGQVIVRGGGDLATGTVYKLVKCGFSVLVLETACPSAIRRDVAFSEAVYEGKKTVEGMTARLAETVAEARRIMDGGEPAVLVDDEGTAIYEIRPDALVDAILAKKNLGTHRGMAPRTVALGPGFRAGLDVDYVIETKRGHRLGRVLETGEALPDTGVPGMIGGYGRERVVHAPAAGIFLGRRQIGDLVEAGEVIGVVEGGGASTVVTTKIGGVLRGILRDGFSVTKGFKTADVDPRAGQQENCRLISDKARCIAGGVLEALLR